MTTDEAVDTIVGMPAELITRFKDITADGAVLEVVIWKVPKPVPPSGHRYKYRAVYVVDGVRIVVLTMSEAKAITATSMVNKCLTSLRMLSN